MNIGPTCFTLAGHKTEPNTITHAWADPVMDTKKFLHYKSIPTTPNFQN